MNFHTTDYRTIEIFEPCERFLSCFDKNLWQAAKIFFGCRNGEIILIPTLIFTYSILLGNLLHTNPPPTHNNASLTPSWWRPGPKHSWWWPGPQRWTYWWMWPWWTGRSPSKPRAQSHACVQLPKYHPAHGVDTSPRSGYGTAGQCPAIYQ